MSEKKHPPTPTRLKELRKKGQHPQPARALEAVVQVAMLAAVYLLAGQAFAESTALWMSGLRWTADTADMLAHAASLLLVAAALACGLMAAGPSLALIASRRVSLSHIKPKPEAFNPASVFGRLFGKAQRWTHTFGAVSVLVSAGVYLSQKESLIVGEIAPDTAPGYSIAVLWSATVMHFALVATVPPAVKVILLPIDLLAKRLVFLSQNKMSEQDLRDEHKNTEGNPEIKMAQRQIQMEDAT